MANSELPSDERLLHLLKTRGPQRAAVLGEALAITPSGVRQHLATLTHNGLVRFEDRRESAGRPKRYWSLTEQGHARFPDSHAQLTSELIRSVRAVFGDEGLDRLIDERERVTMATYRKHLRGIQGLAARVQRLAELRAAEGYMASAREEEDGSWMLVEQHCPICVAAAECQGFCRSELEIFRSLLGRRVHVEREDHVLAGARRCAYRIRVTGPG